MLKQVQQGGVVLVIANIINATFTQSSGFFGKTDRERLSSDQMSWRDKD